MGFRFRKSVNLGGGTKLNISKSGIGISTGIKGARKSINTSGKSRTTLSLPGTGLSYVKESGGKSGPYHQSNTGRSTSGTYNAGQSAIPSGSNRPPKKPFFQRPWVAILFLFFFAPVGIFLIWKYFPQWKKGSKIALSVVFGVFWVAAAFGGGSSKDNSQKVSLPDVPTAIVETQQGENNSAQASRTMPESPEASAPEKEPEASDATPNVQTPSDSIVAAQSEPDAGDNQQGFVVSEPDTTEDTPERSTPVETPDPEPSTSTPVSYNYVGSIESNKYHFPGCRHAKKILPENLIGWNTVEEARAAGYEPCGTCNPW